MPPDVSPPSSILPLNIKALCLSRNGRGLLKNIEFTLARGGLTLLMGPNGSGKSLLLKLCHGLLAPDSGSIVWNLSGGRKAGKKRHALVAQSPILLRRSVRENLLFPLQVFGMSAKEAREKCENLLQHFKLSALAQVPARRVSGGEQQRLALARAASCDPEVIFLDEPCSQLDPSSIRHIEEMLQMLLAQGVTLVMATHDLAQARRLQGSVLFLANGELIEQNKTQDFLLSPQHNIAQAFIAGNLG